jgi:hypothetical protein
MSIAKRREKRAMKMAAEGDFAGNRKPPRFSMQTATNDRG